REHERECRAAYDGRRVSAAHTEARCANERPECARKDHALEANVDDARALDHDFAERGERQRRRGADRRLDEGGGGAAHSTVDVTAFEALSRSMATSPRMTPASTTETTTDGTPASRCIAAAPD